MRSIYFTRSLLLIICCVLLHVGARSQSNPTNPYIPVIIPPSPNAASLLKFTDVPVSPYTGTADVSVPIFDIQARGLDVPISLNYHTGGIKIKEESGWVGLGWALSAGGAISRTIMDHDDFNTGVPYFTSMVPQLPGDMSNTQFAQASNEPVFSQYFFDMFCTYKVNVVGGTEDFTQAFQQGSGFYDIEPDIYNYSFPGHSGKFIILRNRQVVLQKQDNIRIAVDNAGNVFTVTDEHGNNFIFADRDSSGSATGIGSTYSTSSWNLSKIKTQLNDSVMFTYASDNSWTYIAPEIYETYNTYCSSYQGYFRGNPAGTYYLNKTLQTIDFSNGQLQFSFDANRTDLSGGKKLNAIKVYSKAGTSLNYVREQDFYYSYFDAAGDNTPAQGLELKRLRLDSVKKISGTFTEPPYSFSYFPQINSGGDLSKHGFSVDHWGFYNGLSNNTYIPNGIYQYSPPGPSQPGPGLYYTYNGANREPDPTAGYTELFALQQITYPTGGKTVLTYSQNDYDDQKSKAVTSTDFPQYTLHQVMMTIPISATSTGTLDLSGIFPQLPSGSPTTNITVNVFFRGTGNDSIDYHYQAPGLINFRFTTPTINFTEDITDASLAGAQGQWSKNSQFTVIGAPSNCGWSAYIDPSVNPRYFQEIDVSISYKEFQTTYNNNPTLFASGLRVNTITDYSSANTIAKQRTFNYGYSQDKLGTGTPQHYTYGKLMSYPSYVRYTSNPNAATNSYCTSLTFYGSSYNSLTSVINGNIVGYDQVTESIVDSISGIDIGKTEYTYFNSPDSGISYGGFRLPGALNIGNNLNGSLLSKTIYANNNGKYQPVSKTVNNYHTANRNIYYSPKYWYPPALPGTLGGDSWCTPGHATPIELYTCFYPSLKSEKILLDSSNDYIYDQNIPSSYVVTTKNYYYDNPLHYLLTRNNTIDSKGNTLTTRLKYPQDYIPNGSTWTNNSILDTMIGRNMVSETIEKQDSLYYSGSNTGYITGAQLSLYRALVANSNTVVPDKIYKLDIQSPVTNFQPFSFTGNITSLDNRNRQMISFDQYDPKNNIQQYTSTDQNPVAVIWDYLNKYPVAQIKNAAITDVAATSFEADGTGNWNFPTNGDVSSQVTVTVNAANTLNIFTSQTPVSVTDNDHRATVGQELGLKFTSGSAGYISGIRFYKTSGNTGTHIGELYSSTGTRLAQATFTNETATGWQTVLFSSPVTITAGTTYTAAYFSSLGNYVEDNDYFLHNSVSNSPLNAAADGTNGGTGTDPGTGQGTFLYTASAAFPNQIYRSANYWVDVVYSSGTTPIANAGSNQSITLPMSTVTLNGSSSMGIITSYSWTRISGPNTPTITTPTSVTTTVTGLIAGVYQFQLSVNGTSTSQVAITVNAAGTPINIFTTQTPVAVTDNDHQATVGQELGVKFTSAVAGTITGIRFYKTTGNAGTHTGELYSAAGVRLAQATFSGETTSGWQTVTFSSPVNITANSTYVAAYFSSLGNYTEDNDYFLGHSVVNGNLTAPQDGTSGAAGTDPGTGQGLYKYTSAPAYPDQLYRSANYWVDVLFVTGTSPTASAGNSQTTALPNSTVTLDGSGSSGTIASYLWSQVSGPNNPTITSPTSSVTTVTGLVQGTYSFMLSVSGGINSSSSYTGSKSYNLSGNSISKTGLTSGSKYVLSYWSRGSACSISGGSYTSIIGKTINGWTYFEHVVTMTSTSLSITGTNFIDELRLYPITAQMTTYTYSPLVGVTSSCDVDNRVSYYFYDGLGRLYMVKDQDGNIIKTYQYHYQGIPTQF